MIGKNVILSLIVLAAALVGAKAIITKKPQANLKPQVELGVLVENARFASGSQEARVIGQGIIEPAERINLIAQVSGVVSRVHAELSVGGKVKKGTKLVQIDPTDYSIAINEAKARVKIAEQEVALESGRRAAAQQEWEVMQRRGQGREVSEASRSRALREPQAAIASNNLKIAKSALRRALVGYGRTALKAPFNAVVLSESVDQGQLVGPGAPVATLAGTDAFWVTASIPTAELGWIDFPPEGSARRGKRSKRTRALGSKALVRYDVGAYVIEREGRVIRQLTQVETTGRMARVVIEILDPLGLKDEELKPLLLGAQVEVEIIGKTLEGVTELPRSVLHDDDKLWLFSAEAGVARGEARAAAEVETSGSYRVGSLELREVKVLRRRKDTILIRGGLSDDELVITSRIPTPVPGMRLRAAP